MELTNDFRVALPVDRAWAVLTDVERIAPCLPGAQLQEIEGDVYRGVVKIKVGPITAQYKGQATFVQRDEANHVAVLRAEGRETRGQGHASATITATLTPDDGGTAVSVVTDLTVTGRVAQFGRGVLADVSAKLLGQFVDSLEQTVLAGEPAAPTPEPPTKAAVADAEPKSKTKPRSKPSAKPDAAGAAAAALADAAPADVSLGDPVEAVTPDADELTGVTSPTPAAAEPGPNDGPVTTPTVAPTPTAPSATPAAERPVVRKIDMPEPTPVDLLGAAGSPVARRVGPVLAIIAVLWVLKKILSRNR